MISVLHVEEGVTKGIGGLAPMPELGLYARISRMGSASSLLVGTISEYILNTPSALLHSVCPNNESCTDRRRIPIAWFEASMA